MSEFEEDEVELKYIPYASDISKKSLEDFPNVKHFLEISVKQADIVAKQVGRSFQYHQDIVKNRYFSPYALFIEYFIMKCLSNQYNVELTDKFTDKILENPDDYIIGTNTRLRDAITEHYVIFKDLNTQAMDIIKSIKVVSLSHVIYFSEPIPNQEYSVNEDNLREIIRYLESLPYNSVVFNPCLDCKYFNGHADIVFDNDVIYEMKSSKYKPVPLNKFYQTIIYGFSMYMKTGVKVKKFKIYNPLLGVESSLESDNIDYKLFEKVLKHDVTVYSRLQEVLKDKMVLDLSLFAGEEIEN
ncbi:uncharacterized protein LOC135951884 [Calliphora vicina]|uniref:uncharacterized protein LOC135951884 n=1 Tax=Calliphora vicina TaxID=7373 RepID=UPI00325B73E6